MYTIFAVAAAMLGYLASPQNKINSLQWHDFISWVMFSGVSLSLSSFINGNNWRVYVRSKLDFIVNLLVASMVGGAVAAVFVYLTRIENVGRWVFGLTYLFYVLLVLLHSFWFCRWRRNKITVIGAGASTFDQICSDLKNLQRGKYDAISEDITDIGLLVDRIAGLNNDDLYYVILNEHLNVKMHTCSDDIASRILRHTRSINAVIEQELEVVNIGSMKGMFWWEIDSLHQEAGFNLQKRLIDIVLLVILSIPAIVAIILACIFIKIDDGGPVLYKQLRLGRFGRPFQIFKLRTMTLGSEGGQARWASVGDPRVTKVGRILRLTRLDELPQLWNIMQGEMSFVGPRPERPEFYEIIAKEIPEFKIRLAVKPGLSGWAQVNYPYGASIKDAENKLRYDLYYIKRSCLVMELKVITRTLFAMVKGAR